LSLSGNDANIQEFGINNICEKLLNKGVYFNKSNIIVMNNQRAGLCYDNSIKVWANNIDKVKNYYDI